MFIRKTTTTTMTSAAPSSEARVNRLSSDCSMKSACRNRSRWICMPGGSARWMSSSVASIRAVSSSVLTAGCFWMPTMTAGRALCDPSPRLIAAPSRTVPTSRISTGAASVAFTLTAAMASMSVEAADAAHEVFLSLRRPGSRRSRSGWPRSAPARLRRASPGAPRAAPGRARPRTASARHRSRSPATRRAPRAAAAGPPFRRWCGAPAANADRIRGR